MVYRESYKVQSRDRAVSFHDVTDRVREIAKKSGIQNGIVVVYTHHTTCSVITQESGIDMSMTGLDVLQQDLVNVFEKVIPTCRTDPHVSAPGPQNGGVRCGARRGLVWKPQYGRAPAFLHHRPECDHRNG